MYDPRNRLAVEVSGQLHEHFGEKVYRTVIPRNVRLAEAPSHGLPIRLYDPHSKGAEAYATWVDEVMQWHEAQFNPTIPANDAVEEAL